MTVEEGYLKVADGQVWYRSVAEGGTPLLCLHGGPTRRPSSASTRSMSAASVPGRPAWRHDECTPGHLAAMHERIPGSQLAVVEDASHLCFPEQPAEFTGLVNTFLDRQEAAAPTAEPS